jgi:HK97 family phage major capsid protein
MNTPIPVRPAYTEARSSQSKSFWRACYGSVIGTLTKENPQKIVERSWGRDETAQMITRAVSAPANTTTSGWASDVVPIGLANFLVTLAPASVAARLYQSCVHVDFNDVNQVLIPKITTAPTGTWVAEGSAASMTQPVYGSVVVGPARKLLFGAACTNELQNYSAESATSIIQRTLIDAATVALDTALLDNAAVTTARPAGLLNGLSTLGATAGGGTAALTADLAKIAAAMYAAKISAEDMIVVMNPAQATGPARFWSDHSAR